MCSSLFRENAECRIRNARVSAGGWVDVVPEEVAVALPPDCAMAVELAIRSSARRIV